MTSKEAEKRFIENGGILLEKLISSWNGKCCPIRSFSAKELEQATNDYDPVNFLCDNNSCKWYKGSIKGGRVVSIKKYDDNRNDKIFNDIAVAAQLTAHNNILKLIGCCLETHIPIPVYEFAENGTLYSRIHITSETPPSQPILWKSRLRIATDIASAIAYLHTASHKPIIHRDIKPSNIFLDQHNVAKLSGFQFSIAIPEGETHVEDQVIGTFGYVSPEYVETGLVTEKNDVYSFGALLMELLSGRKPYGDGLGLPTFFRTHVLSNEDNQVLDPTILQEVVGQIDVQQQVRAVSELALRCAERDMEERPTMLDVARQLLQLKRNQN